MVVRFRLNMTAQQATDLLAAHYASVVDKRHGKLILDENTTNSIISFAEYITQQEPKFGVMLCGTCGNGKTTLVYALQSVINSLQYTNHFDFIKELDPYYYIGLRIIDVREIIYAAADQDKFREFCMASMLAIDDMGKEPVEVMHYGNSINPIIELMEYRYQHQKFTVITTNLTAKDIREKYGTRVADRFNEMLHVIVFQDITYRR